MTASDCGKPCFPGDPEIGGTGACRFGLWRCEDDGGMSCQGWVGPKAEECNGEDDNCDGRVDEWISNDPHLCQTGCGTGIQQCIRGRWTECSAPKPKPEVCNGRDDDCDGVVDNPESLRAPDGGTDLGCFTGAPPASPNLGVCHGGSWRCIGGAYTCFGQQLPMSETCNGLDDDCDGQVDEGAGGTDLLDFVMVFDNSGSMADVAAATKLATQTWVQKYGARTQRRYALVAAPDNDISISYPRVVTDFTDTVGFAAAMGLQTGSTGSGSEPSLDAVSQIVDDQVAPVLIRADGGTGLSWRTGSARVVVVLSDEPPQSYVGTCVGACPALVTDVSNRLAIGKLKLHVFTRMDYDPWQQWLVLTAAGRGKNWDIAAPPLSLEQFLDDVIQEVTCQP